MRRSISRTVVFTGLLALLAVSTLILHSPVPVSADWATPFVGIHNQVGDVSKAHGYVVALGDDERSTHFLVIVTTDTMRYVVIRAKKAKEGVIKPNLLGRPVIIEGKVVKREQNEKTGEVTVELEILSVERPPRKGSGDSRPGSVKLEFLSDTPEFHELHLGITQDELESLIRTNNLLVTVEGEGGEKTYHVYRQDGENVIVMFRDGVCSGVQRMRRDVSGVPKPK